MIKFDESKNYYDKGPKALIYNHIHQVVKKALGRINQKTNLNTKYYIGRKMEVKDPPE